MISDDRPHDDGQNFYLTTRQVAEDLETSPEAIRKLKCENADRLLDGVHWVKTDTNNLLWSDAGKAVLNALKNGNVPENHGPVTGEDETLTTQALQPPDSTDAPTLDQFADDMATAIARDIVWGEVRKRIPSAITREIIRLLSHPDAKAEFQGIAAEWISPLQSEAIDSAVRANMIAASRNGHKQLTGVGDA